MYLLHGFRSYFLCPYFFLSYSQTSYAISSLLPFYVHFLLSLFTSLCSLRFLVSLPLFGNHFRLSFPISLLLAFSLHFVFYCSLFPCFFRSVIIFFSSVYFLCSILMLCFPSYFLNSSVPPLFSSWALLYFSTVFTLPFLSVPPLLSSSIFILLFLSLFPYCFFQFLPVSIKGKVIPVTGRPAREVVRRRGSHIFWTVGSEMAVRLSALRVCRPLPPRNTPGTHFC
jgi:hypothetical protein